MKFILNTSIDPHFCFFADEKNNIVDLHIWENRRLDGKEVFEFLEKHSEARTQVDFIGGVSGPGGFSSLRVGAGIINALAVAQDIKIRSIRADQWVAALLEKSGENIPFVLNSFGNGVFVPREGGLDRVLLNDVIEQFKDKSIYVGLLPEEKKSRFSNSAQTELSLTSEEALKSLVDLLGKDSEKKLFIPTYEVNAV